jgi:hypothetical protein
MKIVGPTAEQAARFNAMSEPEPKVRKVKPAKGDMLSLISSRIALTVR